MPPLWFPTEEQFVGMLQQGWIPPISLWLEVKEETEEDPRPEGEFLLVWLGGPDGDHKGGLAEIAYWDGEAWLNIYGDDLEEQYEGMKVERYIPEPRRQGDDLNSEARRIYRKFLFNRADIMAESDAPAEQP